MPPASIQGSQRLNICILTETYQPEVGGGETQARLLAEGLLARGHAARILTRRSSPATAWSECVGGIAITRLPPSGRGQVKKWGLLLSSLPWLVTHHRQYDVIFVSGFRIVGITAVVASRLLGKLCVLKADSQGEMSGDFFGPGLRRLGLSHRGLVFRGFLRMRNWLLRRAHAFAAISDEIASELAAQGVPSRQIYRVPNGVDTNRFAPVSPATKARLRAKLGLPAAVPIVIYTGRLVSYKGLPRLLAVWRDLRVRQVEACLVLVGTGGLDIHNCEDELKQFVKANALAPWVIFTGNVPNVEEYLQAADLFAFPTENDAFPSSLVEAMACGLPVVSTPVGAIPSVITHERNGLLVEAANEQALCQAIERLLSDRALAERLSHAGRKSVHDQFSAEIVTRAYLDLFQALARAPVAGPQASPRPGHDHE